MSRAEKLLMRLSESTFPKIRFSLGSIKLPKNLVLRKQTRLDTTEIKTKLDEEPLESEVNVTNNNTLKVVYGLGKIGQRDVLFINVYKTKPYQSLVIHRNNIIPLAKEMAKMANEASKDGDDKGIDYIALAIEGNFDAGKETKRFRMCVYNVPKYIGGRIQAKNETDGNQIYIIGP